MSRNAIHDALATRLVAIQSSGTPPIAGENFDYDPVVGTLYLSEKVFPSGNVPLGTGNADTDRHQGLYQVTVHGKAGDGRNEVEEQADLVAAHFPKGGEYTSGGITVRVRRVEIEQGFNSEGWYVMPVSVYWQAII